MPVVKESKGFQTAVGLVIGLVGGFLSGLAGVGGGIIMVPLMTGLGRLSQHKAHGTSLVAIVFTGAIGAATYFSHGTVDWTVAVLLAATAIVTARFGALYAHSLSEKKLKKAFGVFLIVVSAMLILKGYLLQATFVLAWWIKVIMLLITGLVAGFLSGMMGVGGGAIMVPLMVILAGMGQHLAQGTSLLAMVPISVSGAVTHYRLGNVFVPIAGGLIVGGIAGGYLGGTAANMIPEFYLKLIFAGVGVWMGLRYLRR